MPTTSSLPPAIVVAQSSPSALATCEQVRGLWTSARCGASIRGRYPHGGTIMKKLSMLGIAGGAALLAAVPVSLQWSQEGSSVPLLTLSHAEAQYYYGPYRRHVRRVYRRAYRRAGYPYSYGGYPNSYGGYQNPYPSCLGQYPC